jgi:hypothetical protein
VLALERVTYQPPDQRVVIRDDRPQGWHFILDVGQSEFLRSVLPEGPLYVVSGLTWVIFLPHGGHTSVESG